MDIKTKAKLLLLEIEAIQHGDFKGNNSALLVLVNEALRDAYHLAQDILVDVDWEDEEYPDDVA